MTLKEILSLPVAFQDNSWGKISTQITVSESLEMIRIGTHKQQVEKLRGYLAINERDTYDQEKKRLPAVTFSANFRGERNRQSISNYNFLCVLDIDKLTLEKLDRVKQQLVEDPYVFSFWDSPSRLGIKGLVYFKFPENMPIEDVNFHHTYGFRKIHEYLKENYGIEIDKSGSDVTRLCFFSYDPALYIQDSITFFPITFSAEDMIKANELVKSSTHSYSSEATMNQKFNTTGKNSQHHRSMIQGIIRFLFKRNLSITNSFKNWYEVGYALSNTFTFELAIKYYLSLSKMDGKDFNEQGCMNMLEYCFANSMGKFTFGTIVFYAKKVGYGEGRGT